MSTEMKQGNLGPEITHENNPAGKGEKILTVKDLKDLTEEERIALGERLIGLNKSRN